MLRVFFPMLIMAMTADAAAQQPIGPSLGDGIATSRIRADLKLGAVKIVSGSLDVDVVQRHLRRGTARFRVCVEREHKRGWAANGTVMIAVELDKAGRVSTARVHATSLPTRPTLDACLLRSMRSLQFLATQSAGTFHVPMRLQAPANLSAAKNLADPDAALATAATAKEQARAALKRSKCLTRASSKLARLARSAKRSSAERRLQLAPRIEAAQASVVACNQETALAEAIGSLGNQPCGLRGLSEYKPPDSR